MITELLMQAITWAATAIIGLLPAWDFGVDPQLNSNPLISSLQWVNVFLPVTEILQLLYLLGTLVFGLWSFKWGVKLWDWIMDIIP